MVCVHLFNFVCACLQVRQGDVTAGVLGEIDMSTIRSLTVRIDDGTAQRVIIDELSVRSVGAFHTGLTPNMPVEEWAESVLFDLRNPCYSFDVVLVEDEIDVGAEGSDDVLGALSTTLGSYVCDSQRVVDTMAANGVDSFVDFSLSVVLMGNDVPLWKACLALKLMPVERYADLVADHSRQLGVESEWFCKCVLLETALANGLSCHVRDLVLATTTASSSRGSYVLEDIARVERWIDEYKQNMENQLTDMLTSQLSPYMLRKTALTYEPVAGQFSSMPIAVSSALQLRLNIIDAITVVIESLRTRKQMDTLSSNMSFAQLRSRQLNMPQSAVTALSASSQQQQIPLVTPGRSSSINAMRKSALKQMSMSTSAISFGATLGNDSVGSSSSQFPGVVSALSSSSAHSGSTLDKQIAECNCFANCFRTLITTAIHPNLSLRSFFPSRLSCSFPSVSLANTRTARLTMLRSSLDQFLPPSCQFSESLLRCLIDRALPTNHMSEDALSRSQQLLFGHWDVESLLIPSNFSEMDCHKWVCSLFLLPINVSRLMQSSSSLSSASSSSCMSYAYMVVIYQLIDALWVTLTGDYDAHPNIMNSSNSSSSSSSNAPTAVPGTKTRDRREYLSLITDFALVLGTAVNLSFAHQRLLLAMWRVEHNVDVENAVKDLTTGPAAGLAQQDDALVKEIICKSLAWELLDAQREYQQRVNNNQATVDADKEVVLGHGASFQLISYFATTVNTPPSLMLQSSMGAILLLSTYLQPPSWEVSD
jgi:hypothetical protein